MILAAKCAPEASRLKDIERAGIQAVELFLSKSILKNVSAVIKTCKGFGFKYAVHAPNDDYNPLVLAELVDSIGSEIVVMHDIYWEDEWLEISKIFKQLNTKVCVENISSTIEPQKFMRRFDFGRCLDIEHMQFEVCGFFEEEFVNVMKEASHIHLTGYSFGSDLWHAPIHHSPEHNGHIISLLNDIGYKGMLVSEAKVSYQTYEEFKALKLFFNRYQS